MKNQLYKSLSLCLSCLLVTLISSSEPVLYQLEKLRLFAGSQVPSGDEILPLLVVEDGLASQFTDLARHVVAQGGAILEVTGIRDGKTNRRSSTQ